VTGALVPDWINYTAQRALRALELLAFMPTTAPRLAESLGVHPRTARRLLRQLQHAGWLSYGAARPYGYAPTLRIVALAAHVVERSPLVRETTPAIERLRADTRLTVSLYIPAYDATVCVARCWGEQAEHPPLRPLAPAHCTAAGKVLLAYRDAWRRSVLLRGPLPSCTERSVTDADVLKRQLAQVRANGYAVEDGEHVPGVRALAAPVVVGGAEIVAAIALVTNDERALNAEADRVCTAAREASEALRKTGPDEPRGLHDGL
jgi:DNA-binding IclR family transcriptional regulator